MKRFSEQFKKQSETIRMRASERNELKERLLSYMEYHPLPKEIAHKKSESRKQEAIMSEPFKVFKFNPFYVKTATSVFALFVVLTVPVVAERAVPGDVLYPVKVQFNEELRSSLALSPYAKVVWETERLERRISEARLLASEGKLTEETETQVAEAVKTHSDAAQREIAQLRESDSEEAAIAEIAFASALAVQTEVLEGHIEKNENQENGVATNGHSVAALAQVVAEEQSTAEAAQELGAQLSYDKLLGRVETESTRIYELFASVKKEASANEVTNIERRLADIERKIEKAVARKEGRVQTVVEESAESSVVLEESEVVDVSVIDAASSTQSTSSIVTEVIPTEVDEVIVEESEESLDVAEKEAIKLLRSALTDIQKLLNYMTHIDVRENVSIEDLVPVSLTDDEKNEEVERLLQEVATLKTVVATRDVDTRLKAKTSEGITFVDKKIAEALGAVKKKDFDSALAAVRLAQVFMADIAKITLGEPLLPPDAIETASTTDVQVEI